jgi:hydroxymethylpyrimidine/phosphomethylpyrimidine kinase
MRSAARSIHEEHGCAVLVKGGHLKRMKEAIDIFYDGKEELRLSAPFVRGVKTHGTGCTYSAAIVANLAVGHGLAESIKKAKDYVTKAISNSYKAPGGCALEHFNS